MLAISVLKHPLLLAMTMLALLCARRCWRSIVTRGLWVKTPALVKALLELHSSVLGVGLLRASNHNTR